MIDADDRGAIAGRDELMDHVSGRASPKWKQRPDPEPRQPRLTIGANRFKVKIAGSDCLHTRALQLCHHTIHALFVDDVRSAARHVYDLQRTSKTRRLCLQERAPNAMHRQSLVLFGKGRDQGDDSHGWVDP